MTEALVLLSRIAERVDRLLGRPDFDESERQMVLLALALTARLRPGFDYCCGQIAAKLSGRAVYDAFKSYNADVLPQREQPGGSELYD